MIQALDLVIEAGAWELAPPVSGEPAPGDVDPATQDHGIPVIVTAEDLEKFIWDTFQIRISKHACCPAKGHRSPWEAFCYAYFADGPVCVWKASRGFGGKSFMLSLLAQVEAITLHADVKVLGGSGDQSKRVLHYTELLWELPSAPRHVLANEPGARVTKLVWGNTIEALMASTKSVRGPHPQRLRLDEIDEMQLKVLNAAAGQTMSKGWVKSQTVMSSTHHYPQGTFTQKLQEAADKGWPVFEWCYRANLESNGGWLPDSEIARKQIEVPTSMWTVEYEGQEPSAEGRAFDTEAVKAMFQEGRTCVLADGTVVVAALEEQAAPGGTYGTGADWARKVDYTAIGTLRRDVKPMTLVAIKRGHRRPWPTMIQWLSDILARFPGRNRHDRTGLGDVVHDFAKLSEDDGVIMVGRDRADLLSEYVSGVERGEVIVPWPDILDDSDQAKAIRVMKKEHEYATVEDLYGSDKGKLPDTVAMGALAYKAAKVPPAVGGTREPTPDPKSILQTGIQTGRMSGYMGLGRRRPLDPNRGRG